MSVLCRLLLTGFLFLFAGFVLSAPGQSKGSSSISGKITVGGKPAKGVPVIARSADSSFAPKPASASASTDDEGRFRLTGLSSGRYVVTPYEPTKVVPGRTQWDPGGKSVTLSEDESVENIDFALSPGGVITGRITNAEGRPLIEQRLTVESVDTKMNFGGMYDFNDTMYQTDDRGIYRIYGLPAGKYLVSIGEDKDSGTMSFGFRQTGYYIRTFHPGVTDKSQAKIVELGDGGEETGVDIALGPREKLYAVSGHLVDANSGKPVPNVYVGLGEVLPGENSFRASGWGGIKSDDLGQFRMEGMKPGNYAVFAAFENKSDDNRTSNAVPVEVTDSDVDDVEIKVSPGIKVDGVAVLEGTADPSALAKMQQLTVGAWGESSGQLNPPNSRSSKIGSDNTFHLNGLSPGKLRIMLYESQGSKGFLLLRVEQNGVSSPDNSIEITQGTEATNVRLVLDYGTGVIRGQVTVTGGVLPQGAAIGVSVQKVGQRDRGRRSASLDARGRFVIENLSPGEYEVRASAYGVPRQDPNSEPPVSAPQRVTVTNSGEANVNITLNLNAPNPGGDPQ